MSEGVFMNERPRAFRVIALTFAVITVILLGFVAYSTLGHATVTITLGNVSKEVSFRVPIAEVQPGQAAPTGTLPATFFETTDSATDSFVPTGAAASPTSKAGGSVTLHNNTDHDQPLVATTRLLSPDNILFRLQTAVRVPAHGTTTGFVVADKPGPSGAIGASTFTIPGLSAALQKDIYADSRASMTLGADTQKTVSQQDLDAARQTLLSRLQSKAATTVGSESSAASLTPQNFISNVLQETSSAKAGDKAQSFTMTVKADIVGVSFQNADLVKHIQDDAGGAQVTSPDSITYTLVNYDPILKTVTASGKATVTSNVVQSSSIFSAVNFVNMTPEQVQSFLSNYDGISAVRVDLSP